MATNLISKAKLHTEEAFEQHLVSKLISQQKYLERHDSDYDRDLAFDKDLLVDFIQKTQPETWQVLEGRLGGKASEMLCKEIDRVLKKKMFYLFLKRVSNSHGHQVSSFAILSQQAILIPT